MSLYAIGDLHLHYQSVLKAPGQLHGRVWKNHEEKIRKNCAKTVTPEDTLVLVGDHSWGKNLSECERDLQYIRELPGRKILTRGNHDMFWDVKKTGMLNELYKPDLTFVQDSYDSYQDYAIVATKGFTFEGPFYIDRRGRIVGWDEEEEEHARKLVARELVRWWPENWCGFGNLLTWRRQMDIASSLCSCTIRLPASWKREAASRIWRRNTAPSR